MKKNIKIPLQYKEDMSKFESTIIGWYCQKCEILHEPTMSCPITALKMKN
jgi:hypothetical protein